MVIVLNKNIYVKKKKNLKKNNLWKKESGDASHRKRNTQKIEDVHFVH